MKDITNRQLEYRIANTVSFWAMLIIAIGTNRWLPLFFAALIALVGWYTNYHQDKQLGN